MSIVIAIKMGDQYSVLCDCLSVKLNGTYRQTVSGAQKVFQIDGYNMVYGFCGVKNVGLTVQDFLKKQLKTGYNGLALLFKCASYLKGINDGFSQSKASDALVDNGLSPLTGIIIVGYWNDLQFFHMILPNGEIISPDKFCVIGYNAEVVSSYLKQGLTVSRTLHQLQSLAKLQSLNALIQKIWVVVHMVG